jgi:hypothetical protein
MDFGNISTNIIKKGLVFNMDFANRASYPKTGTIVTNTINNSNSTLTNGPTFSDSNGGIMHFDFTDDYISTPSSWTSLETGDFTVCSWFRVEVVPSGNSYIWVMVDAGANTNYANLRVNSSNQIQFQTREGGGGNALLTYGTTYSTDTWYQATCIRTGTTGTLYLNGTNPTSLTNSEFGVDLGDELYIGNWRTFTAALSGDIGPIQIYNRVLSASEVLFNYNGLKSRFGL